MMRLVIIALCLMAGGTALAADQRLPAFSTGERLPGKFVWFDLIAPDAVEARRFYHAVFGWDFTPVRSGRGSYTLIQRDDEPLGGIFEPAATPSGALWLAAISVPDIERAKTVAKANGAEIVLPIRELPDLGKRLLLRDPQGALIAVVETTHGDPADQAIAPGGFFWVDLFTRDRHAAAGFYRDLAGYEVDEREFAELTRLVLASQGFARAGIAPLPADVDRPGWLPYVLVEDVAATLERARQAGGEPLVEPTDGLLDGRLAVLADPAGGVIGVLQWPAEGGQ